MKTKVLEHVLWRPPGTLLCLHCAARYDMALPAPIDMVSAMSLSFEKSHKRCKRTERGLACQFCSGFGHEATSCDRLRYRGDPYAWLNGPDTGMSSKTIWSFMMGGSGADPSSPYDPDDFGRCHRLLHAFPAWRARIGEMSSVRGWDRLAPAWDELEALWNEEVAGKQQGSAPKLYARMRELYERPLPTEPSSKS